MSDGCLDTDVASLIQTRREPDWVRAHLIGQRVWLTFVTVGELAKWAEIRSWGPLARERLDRWLAARGILPYDETIARTWGWLAARAQKRGRPRPHNDMWIAACCLRHGIPLATLNTKDFEDFVDLDELVPLRPSGAST